MNTEKESLKRGEAQKKETKPALGAVMMEDGTEIPYDDDLIAVFANRAAEALEAVTPEDRILVDNHHTFVASGSEHHQRAHEAAREVRPGTDAWSKDRCGQFGSIARLAAEARDKRWCQRTTQGDSPSAEPSRDR